MYDAIHGETQTTIRVGDVQTRKGSLGALRILILPIAILAAFSVAQSQISPPVGPETYRSDAHQIGVGVLTGMVKSIVQRVVADTNTNLQNQGSSIRIEMLPFKFYSPSRWATQYTNRPNQYYVQIPTIVGININIPALPDRQVYYPLDLNLSCDGWQTGHGVVKVLAQPGPPSVEGGSIIEDVIHIRDYVDGQVRSHLPGIATVTQTLANSQCVTIGASPNTGPSDPFAFVAWDAPGRRTIDTATAAFPRLEVTFIKLKRLTARGNGALLYSPTENIMLDVYANYNERQSSTLTMREGDEVTLNIRPVVFNAAELPNSLVLIANLNQQNSTQDSAFAAAMRTANYSPGIHTLQIPKHYVIPPGPGNRKPTIATVAAYEFTYNVNYLSPTLRQ